MKNGWVRIILLSSSTAPLSTHAEKNVPEHNGADGFVLCHPPVEPSLIARTLETTVAAKNEVEYVHCIVIDSYQVTFIVAIKKKKKSECF